MFVKYETEKFVTVCAHKLDVPRGIDYAISQVANTKNLETKLFARDIYYIIFIKSVTIEL